MIKIENLRLDFPGRLRLSIDSLLIREGRIFAVIGPNGAGKSTLLNILALFQRPDKGTIEFAGEDILNSKDKLTYRRKVSFVFSRPYLFNTSVYDNINLPLRLRGIRDAKAVDEMLDLFGISHLRADKAVTLSQGEMHRVSLARALVTRPQLLLLDEPFLSLDPRHKEWLVNQLRDIIHAQASTAIFVTQDQTEALSLADDLTVMMAGAILQQGRPEDIFTRPVSKEVADFAGVETILEGDIVKKEDSLVFIKVGAMTLEAVSEYDAGENVFVCIRPEDVVISRHTDINSARNRFEARITGVEPWGLGYKLSLDCGFSLIASVTKQSVRDLDLRANNKVFASFKATAIHLIRRGHKDDPV